MKSTVKSTVVAVGLAISASAAPGRAGDTATIEQGKEVYRAQRCQVCHSIAGQGNRRSPLDGVGSRLSAADIRKWIVAPQEMKPTVRKKAYDGLPSEQLEALVAYLVSLKE